MPEIGVRQLKNEASEIIRAVREQKTEYIITLRGEPVSVLIDYADWLALQDELDDLRAARQADAVLDEYLRDPSTARPYSEIRAELVAEGLLDEEV
jgi:prevent-host-death family protein